MKKFKYGFYMGRFQPFHEGHHHIVREALKRCEELFILVGSANLARSSKNPFNHLEKVSIIHNFLTAEERDRVTIFELDEKLTDEEWVNSTEQVINHLAGITWQDKRVEQTSYKDIAIFGYKKDESSYYLDMFPNYSYIQIEPNEEVGLLSATDIREHYFENFNLYLNPINFKSEMYDSYFKNLPNHLGEEYQYVNHYKSLWKDSPYPVIFNTVDVVLYCKKREKVLLITRNSDYGKGLLAFPGGFVDVNETYVQSARREFLEEISLLIDNYVKDGLLDSVKPIILDHPNRSLIGRVVSHVYMVDCSHLERLPEPIAGDDAANAAWYDFEELDSEMFFEDHYLFLEKYVFLTEN